MDEIKATESSFFGDWGVSFVKQLCNRNNIKCESITESDYGEDILCEIFTSSAEKSIKVRTQFSFRIQVKTTENIEVDGYIRKTTNGISFSIDVAHINQWIKNYYPIVLVVLDYKAETGYWCFPVECIKSNISCKQKTVTVDISKKNKFDANGISIIKEKVEHYYANLYNLQDAKYSCRLFPVWMPMFRLFSSIETNFLFENTNANFIQKLIVSDMLPTFLTSYNNCNSDGSVSCIEYKSENKTLEAFLEEVKKHISALNISLNNGWVSFVISPVEIISNATKTTISKISDWISLSVIDNKVVTDYEYTFDLSKQYVYSKKVRSMSIDNDFFVHRSGLFAVEILGTRMNQNKHNRIISEFYKKMFIMINIKSLNTQDIFNLKKWCISNNYNYMQLFEGSDIIIISHPMFSINCFGVLMPGVLTWNEYDKLSCFFNELKNNLPYGKILSECDKQRVFKKYDITLHDDNNPFQLINYSNVLQCELLQHDVRIIRFVCTVKSTNDLEEKFNLSLQENEAKISEIFEENKLYIDQFEVYNEVYTDIVLEICPHFNLASKDAVKLIENLFLEIIASLSISFSDENNMAYFVEHVCDRCIAEELINK